MNLNIGRTKQNWIMILVKFKDIMCNSKLCFFSETGILIDENKLSSNNEGYIVLATIQSDSKLLQRHDSFSSQELALAKKYLYNQSSKSKKEYHFKTSGTIHSFGYGAIYLQHPVTKYSVDRFASSKYHQYMLNLV